MIIIKWKRKIKNENIPISIQNMVKDEKIFPQLTGIFVYGAKSVLLENRCGNIDLKLCNGSKCIMRSLGWQRKEYEIKVIEEIKYALKNNKK